MLSDVRGAASADVTVENEVANSATALIGCRVAPRMCSRSGPVFACELTVRWVSCGKIQDEEWDPDEPGDDDARCATPLVGGCRWTPTWSGLSGLLPSVEAGTLSDVTIVDQVKPRDPKPDATIGDYADAGRRGQPGQSPEAMEMTPIDVQHPRRVAGRLARVAAAASLAGLAGVALALPTNTFARVAGPPGGGRRDGADDARRMSDDAKPGYDRSKRGTLVPSRTLGARSDAEPVRVLVVRLSAMGDVIHGIPAIAALRRERPNLQIGWLVEQRSDGAAICASFPERMQPRSELKPLVDWVHVTDFREWRKGLSSPATWRDMRGCMRESAGHQGTTWTYRARSARPWRRGCRGRSRAWALRDRGKRRRAGSTQQYVVQVVGLCPSTGSVQVLLCRTCAPALPAAPAGPTRDFAPDSRAAMAERIAPCRSSGMRARSHAPTSEPRMSRHVAGDESPLRHSPESP